MNGKQKHCEDKQAGEKNSGKYKKRTKTKTHRDATD